MPRWRRCAQQSPRPVCSSAELSRKTNQEHWRLHEPQAIRLSCRGGAARHGFGYRRHRSTLADQTDHDDHPVSAGRDSRCGWPTAGAEARSAARPDGDRGQPSGWGRHHRRQRGVSRAGRWLHAAVQRLDLHDDADDAEDAGLRRRQGLRAGGIGGQGAAGDRRQQELAVQRRQGAAGICPRQSGQADICDRLHRLCRPPQHGTAAGHDGMAFTRHESSPR